MGIERLTLTVDRTVRLVFVGCSRLARTYEGKDAILAPTAPVALIAQLLFWAVALAIGFGLMLAATTHSLADGLLQALTALFTVGAVHIGGTPGLRDRHRRRRHVGGDRRAPDRLPPRPLRLLQPEGGTGRPCSRAAPGRRPGGRSSSSGTSWSGSRTPSPTSTPDWEVWAADVAESHTTYPVLLLFRSPEPWLSWLRRPPRRARRRQPCTWRSPRTRAPSQARLCLRMGFTLMHRIATSLGWTVDPDPDPEGPIALEFAEFAQAVAMLDGVRVPDGADRRGGVAGLPGLAGQLRAASPTDWPTAWSRRRHPGPGPDATCAPAPSSPGGRPSAVRAGRRRSSSVLRS